MRSLQLPYQIASVFRCRCKAFRLYEDFREVFEIKCLKRLPVIGFSPEGAKYLKWFQLKHFSFFSYLTSPKRLLSAGLITVIPFQRIALMPPFEGVGLGHEDESEQPQAFTLPPADERFCNTTNIWSCCIIRSG